MSLIERNVIRLIRDGKRNPRPDRKANIEHGIIVKRREESQLIKSRSQMMLKNNMHIRLFFVFLI